MKKNTIINDQSMKLYALLFLVLTGVYYKAVSQGIGINTGSNAPNGSALLDIDASPSNNKGLLIPRVSLLSTTDVTTIASPANSLMVYNTNATMINGNGSGFYFYDSTTSKWIFVVTSTNGPGTSGQVLTSSGVGTGLIWSTPAAGTISTVTGTAPIFSSGGATPDISLQGTAGGVFYGTGTGSAITTAGTTGQVLTSNGSGAPTWQSANSGTGRPSQWGTPSVGTMTWQTCVVTCANSTEGGFSDWYLPNMAEWFELDATISDGSSTNTFWTASSANNPAWNIVKPSDATWNGSSSVNPNFCRCIR